MSLLSDSCRWPFKGIYLSKQSKYVRTSLFPFSKYVPPPPPPQIHKSSNKMIAIGGFEYGTTAIGEFVLSKLEKQDLPILLRVTDLQSRVEAFSCGIKTEVRIALFRFDDKDAFYTIENVYLKATEEGKEDGPEEEELDESKPRVRGFKIDVQSTQHLRASAKYARKRVLEQQEEERKKTKEEGMVKLAYDFKTGLVIEEEEGGE